MRSQRLTPRPAWFLLGVAALSFLTPLSAQDPKTPASRTQTASPAAPDPKATTISVDVKVVNVLATVRDKHGAIVKNLGKDDFTLQEDGRPQAIRYFSQESDVPLTLGLLVDTSLSQRRVLEKERSASYAFLDQVLREDRDKAFLIHFDYQVELLQDLTSSRQKLQTALNGIEIARAQRDDTTDNGGNTGGSGRNGGGSGGGWPGGGGGWPGGGRRGGGGYPRGGGGGGGGRSPRGGGTAGGTELYDSVYLASDELMKKQPGRKALVVLTDGVDTASKESLASAIEAAQRADTIVYAILFTDRDEQDNGGRGGMDRRRGGGYPQPRRDDGRDGKEVLERVSRETGGRMFEVSKKHPIEDVYKDIQDDLRNQYSLGYKSDKPDPDGAYRRITVAAKPKDMLVTAREGYYAAR